MVPYWKKWYGNGGVVTVSHLGEGRLIETMGRPRVWTYGGCPQW